MASPIHSNKVKRGNSAHSLRTRIFRNARAKEIRFIPVSPIK